MYTGLRTDAFHTYFPSQILFNQAPFQTLHQINHQDNPNFIFPVFILTTTTSSSVLPFIPTHHPIDRVSPSTLSRYYVFITTTTTTITNNRICWPTPITKMSFATSSSSSMRRHPASLLPKMVHNPSLLDLVKCPVSRDMIGEFH